MHKNIIYNSVFLSTTCDFYIRMSKLPYKKDDFQLRVGANIIRKYVTGMEPLVGLLKYVTDFRKITSEQIRKNVKYVTK